MKRKVFMVVASVIILVFLVLTAASFYFYNVAVARADKEFLNGNPDLEVSVSADETPYSKNEHWWEQQAFEDWSLKSDDGLMLHAFYLDAEIPSDKTVIIAHGYSGKAADMGNLAQMYREKLGYNVLLPDARGHGESEGNYIGFGWPERKDYVRWIERVIEHSGNQTQIVLHGVSMGGATVLMTSGEKLQANVKAIVDDCGYTSAKDQLAYQLKRMYHLPSFPLVQTTSLLTKLRAGYFFGEASALEQVKKSVTPTLFIHGDADLFVPTEMVHELYENGPSEKKLVVVPGAGHGLARFVNPEAYDHEVSEFIGAYVK
ncbi:alpha/beta hydrolase [Paenibacillus sp. FSL R5-0407]|uniref:alpha/beta hydrolase n=1 Tax=Paenibacillus TaxID=44249 RepID=UPI0025B6D431|nr:alpha/beta hydrolase [Paenibacillus vini]MDN4068249.1 alpha/beta hydrolase [Paenibacillus vini]